MSKIGGLFYKNFFLVLFIYYTLHIAIKVSAGGVEYDDAEQFLLYQNISLIYDNAQPPLYNWLQYIFFKLFGLNIFAASLLKHLILYSIFIISYLLARELNLSRLNSLIATSALLLLPQVVWGLELKLTHSALLLLISALTFLLLLKFLKSPNNLKAFALGTIIALGFLSKYSYLLLVLSLFIATLLDKNYRKILLSKYILIISLSALAVSLVHIIPLLLNFSHISNEISAKINKNLGQIHGFISLFKATFAFLLPLLLIYVVVLLKLKPKYISISREIKLLIKSVAVIYTITITLISIGVFDDFKERWLLPYLFTLPTILIAILPKKSEDSYKNIFATVTLVVLTLILLIFVTRVSYPDIVYKIRGKYSHDLLKYSAIREHITKEPKYIKTSNLMLGGNIKLVFKNSCVNCQYKPDLVVKESKFKGATEIKIPYINSKNYKSLYIKSH